MSGLPAGPAQPGGKQSRGSQALRSAESLRSRFDVRCRVRVSLAVTTMSLSPTAARYRMDAWLHGLRWPTSESSEAVRRRQVTPFPCPTAVPQGGQSLGGLYRKSYVYSFTHARQGLSTKSLSCTLVGSGHGPSSSSFIQVPA